MSFLIFFSLLLLFYIVLAHSLNFCYLVTLFCGFFVYKGPASFEGEVGCEPSDISECY